jgi:tRNA uridine 5-carbamoylmethylation protein Kti12
METNSIQKYTAAHVEIRQLIDKYNDIVNSRTWNQVPDIFARDAVWIATEPVNLEWKTLNGIIIELPKSVERQEVLIQSSSAVVIDVQDEEHATARSWMSEFGRSKENGDGFRGVGIYIDKLVKENARWKFLERKFVLKYFEKAQITGKLSEYKY